MPESGNKLHKDTGAMFLRFGGIWQGLETVFKNWGEGWHQVGNRLGVEARVTIKHYNSQESHLTTKNYTTPNLNNVKI